MLTLTVMTVVLSTQPLGRYDERPRGGAVVVRPGMTWTELERAQAEAAATDGVLRVVRLAGDVPREARPAVRRDERAPAAPVGDGAARRGAAPVLAFVLALAVAGWLLRAASREALRGERSR